jgi:hypothetical protein
MQRVTNRQLDAILKKYRTKGIKIKIITDDDLDIAGGYGKDINLANQLWISKDAYVVVAHIPCSTPIDALIVASELRQFFGTGRDVVTTCEEAYVIIRRVEY